MTIPEVDWNHVGRIARFAGHRAPPWMSRDDLVQEANLAAWRATARWREDGGASLQQFVARRAEGAVRDSLRTATRVSRDGRIRPRVVALEEAGDPPTIERDMVFDIDLRQTVLSALARLPQKQRRIVIERFLKDRTHGDIGRELGISESAVCVISGLAIKSLRRDCGLRDWVAA